MVICAVMRQKSSTCFQKEARIWVLDDGQLPEFSNKPWYHVRPRVINGSTKSMFDEDNVKRQEHMPYLWKNTGVKPEERRLRMDELGCGQLSGRF